MSKGIPNGWVETTLDSVAIWSSGGTPSRLNPHFFNGTIPWVKTGELGERVIFDSEEKITPEAIAASSAKVFSRGSVVLAMYGATIGKASILGVDSATNQACAVGTPDAVNSRLLYYFLLSQHQAFVDAGKGGAQPNISQGIVKNWPFILPPVNEQTRIVEKLEELFSDLDAGVAELKAAQKKLAQYRQSLLKAAVEGELTAEWRALKGKSAHGTTGSPRTDFQGNKDINAAVRPELVEGPVFSPAVHPSTSSGQTAGTVEVSGQTGKKRGTEETENGAQLLERILKDRRARWEEKQLAKFKEQGKTPPKGWQDKYPEPVQPDTTNLPELPEGWVWASVDQVGEVFLGKMLDKDKHLTGVKLPYLRNISIRWSSIETHDLPEMYFEENELDRYGLIVGDVLVCEGGEPGRAAVCGKEHEKLKYQKALHRVRLFNLYESELLLFYLEHVAKSGVLERFFTGSTIKHFTKESFITLPIPLPPADEQAEIVEQLKSAVQGAQEQNLSITHSLTQAAAQRKNILKSAFSGQLVPQNPDDEPASVLLERIRAGRQAATRKLRGHRNKENL